MICVFLAVAPVVPELSCDTDTRHFDPIDDADKGSQETFPVQKVVIVCSCLL